MKKFLTVFGIILGLTHTALAAENPRLEVKLSLDNLPTQKVDGGTPDIEVFTFRLDSEVKEIPLSDLSNGVTLETLRIKRSDQYDRDQILRYKLVHEADILSKVSMPDTDTIEFKHINLFIPYGNTLELSVRADMATQSHFGEHRFRIDSGEAITLRKTDYRDPDTIIEGRFPVEGNRVIINQSADDAPPVECNDRSEPICGEDGKTYVNRCYAYKKNIEVRHEGQCTKESFPENKACSPYSEPVCGADGKTYRNECEMKKDDAFLAYYGTCFPDSYEPPKTYQSAIELYKLKKNELAGIKADGAQIKTLNSMLKVLDNYDFSPSTKDDLTQNIIYFIEQTTGDISEEIFNQAIEALNVALIEARQKTMRIKYANGENPFLDVDNNDWFSEPIQFMKSQGWITGYQDAAGKPTGFFKPADSVTKAEITKIVFEAADVPYLKSVFPVKNPLVKNHWALKVISQAEKDRLTLWRDYPNPDKKARRSEVIRLLFETFEVEPPNNFPEPTFPDVASDHEDYRYIEYAADLGIISGYPDGTFKPDEPISRAEVSKVVMKAYEEFGAE